MMAAAGRPEIVLYEYSSHPLRTKNPGNSLCRDRIIAYIQSVNMNPDFDMNRCAYTVNRFHKTSPRWSDDIAGSFSAGDIVSLHRSLPGYRPTPSIQMPRLAKKLGVAGLWVKDESHRFDLNAFKVMGASYAIYRFLKQEWEKESSQPFDIGRIVDAGPGGPWAKRYTFCTATDGNHGRAVAWTSKRLFQKAVIYVPQGTAPARIENIRKENARVEIIDGAYDDAVKKVAEDAEANGWQVISDTAYPGYTTIPKYIMAGYTTMFKEMEQDVHAKDKPAVDIVILQGGVGSFAAAAAWYYVNRYGDGRPKLVVVEPTEAACLKASIETDTGDVTTCEGSFETIMAGLNCGTPSIAAWPFIRDSLDLFVAVTDDFAIEAMRRYYLPAGDDPRIVSGESGAAGLAALLALLRNDNLAGARDAVGLGPSSRILVFNTEGATDPDHFEGVIAGEI